MPFFLLPTGDDFIDDFTPTPAGDSFSTVDDDRLLPADDADYIQGDVAAGGSATFSFAWPGNYTSQSYGDDTSPIVIPQIVSVTLHARMARTVAGTSTVTPICTRLASSSPQIIGSTTFSVTSVAPTYTAFSLTSTLDPHTSLAWTSANISNTAFGIQAAGADLQVLRLSRFFLEVTEAYGTGNTRARLGPHMLEPVYTCAICGIPRHISDLVRPEDPLHPNHGQLVCIDDLDESIDVEEESLRGTSLIEGDIDFDVP